MTLESLNYLTALPEIFLLSMACLVLVVDVFISDARRDFSYYLSQLALLGTFGLVMMMQFDAYEVAFNGMFVQDTLSLVLKSFILVLSFAAFVYSRDYLKDRNLFKGEYYVLGLFAVLGMMLMVSANNLLMIYLGLELLSLCLYAMVAFNRDNGNASEAAMKYFVLGAIASGMLLYGMSILYGLSGSLMLSDIAKAITQAGDSRIGMVFGLVFI